MCALTRHDQLIQFHRRSGFDGVGGSHYICKVEVFKIAAAAAAASVADADKFP